MTFTVGLPKRCSVTYSVYVTWSDGTSQLFLIEIADGDIDVDSFDHCPDAVTDDEEMAVRDALIQLGYELAHA